jgi:hypothetical protein
MNTLTYQEVREPVFSKKAGELRSAAAKWQPERNNHADRISFVEFILSHMKSVCK